MIKFGTSGFRGVMGDNFNKENVQRIAYAITCIAQKQGLTNPKVVIGFDMRFMGEHFAKWMCEVLGVKCNVTLYESAVPSPLISFETGEYDFGVVITASHNPYYYNGIKIFLHGKRECDDEFASQIEDFANSVNYSNIEKCDFNKLLGKSIFVTKDIMPYCEAILQLTNVEPIQKSNLKILANVMHGNATECIKILFDKIGLKDYKILNTEKDVFFEYKLPAPYRQNLVGQAEEVVKGGYDLGVAFDGDSDRFSLIDRNGVFYDCNFVLPIIYDFYVRHKGYEGGVVKNRAFTSLMDYVAEDLKRDIYESKTGFKNIALIMESENCFLGGETNGIALKNHIMSKDGIWCAIAIIEIVATLNKPFDVILSEMQKKYNFTGSPIEYAYEITDKKKQEIIDKVFVKKELPKCDKKVVSVDYTEGVKIVYENKYWAMYRFSGNEPVIRIFTEMENIQKSEKMIEIMENFIGVRVRQ